MVNIPDPIRVHRVFSTTSRSDRITEQVPFGVLLLSVAFIVAGCGSTGSTQTAAPAPETNQSPESPPTSEVTTSEADTQESTAPRGEPEKVLRVSNVESRVRDAAQEWYDTPYKLGGESKQGVDCSAFVQSVYEDAFAYELPRVTETQVQVGKRVPRDQIRPGDLVFFKPENEFNHVGVYVGDGKFAHASSSSGVRKSPFKKNYWQKYYWTTRRPLKPSSVPDSLVADLVAYRYPDTTMTVAEAPVSGQSEEPESASEAESENTAEKPAPESENASEETASDSREEAVQIASCSDPDVDCGESTSSTTTASAAGEQRKGW